MVRIWANSLHILRLIFPYLILLQYWQNKCSIQNFSDGHSIADLHPEIWNGYKLNIISGKLSNMFQENYDAKTILIYRKQPWKETFKQSQEWSGWESIICSIINTLAQQFYEEMEKGDNLTAISLSGRYMLLHLK